MSTNLALTSQGCISQGPVAPRAAGLKKHIHLLTLVSLSFFRLRLCLSYIESCPSLWGAGTCIFSLGERSGQFELWQSPGCQDPFCHNWGDRRAR